MAKELQKANNKINLDHHSKLSNLSNNLLGLVNGPGLKIGESVAIKLVDLALNHFLNDAESHSLLS